MTRKDWTRRSYVGPLGEARSPPAVVLRYWVVLRQIERNDAYPGRSRVPDIEALAAGGWIRLPELRALNQSQARLGGQNPHEPLYGMGSRGVYLTSLGLEVVFRQPQGAQALQDETTGPVHRSRRELQLTRKLEFQAAQERGSDSLVVAPVLGSEKAAIRRDRAERGRRGERVEDPGHVVFAPEQGTQELATPLGPSPAELVAVTPFALLGVDFENDVVRIEQAGIHHPDEREDVPPMIGDSQNGAVRHPRQTLGVYGEARSGCIGDNQIKGNGDRGQLVQDLVQKLGVVDVDHDTDAGRRLEGQVGEGTPFVRKTASISSASSLHPSGEIGGRTATA